LPARVDDTFIINLNIIDEKEIKEWDNVLLDLVNKGLIEIIEKEDGTVGFRLKP
jgi:hypothetical protein